MKMARIARFLEFVGDCMPGVHELALLVPAFFGLWSVAKALGLDMDLGPETVVVVSVTFVCFVWIILNSLTYRGAEPLEETRNELPRRRYTLSASPQPQPVDGNAGARLEKKATPINVNRSHGESAQQEKHYPAKLP